MAEFGTFEFGTDVYGVPDDFVVTDVEIITPTLIRFTFNKEVLVNEQFYDPANYEIFLFNTASTDAAPRKVITPYVPLGEEPTLTSLYSNVVTDPLTIGSRYTFMVSNLVNRLGIAITPSFTHKYSRRTKTQSASKSLSSHYDMRSESTVFNVLAAISRSDDLIGGTAQEPVL